MKLTEVQEEMLDEMNAPTEPNLQQKGIIFQNGLNSRNWLVLKETDTKLHIVYRYGKSTKELQKLIKERGVTRCTLQQ